MSDAVRDLARLPQKILEKFGNCGRLLAPSQLS